MTDKETDLLAENKLLKGLLRQAQSLWFSQIHEQGCDCDDCDERRETARLIFMTLAKSPYPE